jgi:hypothetical protein
MTIVALTIHLPEDLWRAVQALASNDGDTNTVILRAAGEYVATAARTLTHHSGNYHGLVQALSAPVADLHPPPVRRPLCGCSTFGTSTSW